MNSEMKEGIEQLTFSMLASFPELTHAITTRGGVIEEDNYSSFNLSPYCGDDPSRVVRNRKTFCEWMKVSEQKMILPIQTHQDKILVVDNLFLEASYSRQQLMLQGVDALITALPGYCVGVSTADCVPLLLYDPVHKVVAAVHAGWKGTVAHISQKCIQVMSERFGSRPEQMRAGVGPSISITHFEVGEEVVKAFGESGFDLSKMHKVSPSTGKSHLDLWQANHQLLLLAGLLPQHIEMAELCTRSNPERFFSARALGIASGRLVSAIVLKE